MLAENITDENKRKKIVELMSVESLKQIGKSLVLNKKAQQSVDELGRLFELIDVMGVGDYCAFDIGIVRGLAYYTGIVFEIYDKANELRAIGGGGRYDNLLKQFGGPAIPATGFGIGDCVLAILLEEKNLLQKQLPEQKLDYFVARVDDNYKDDAVKLMMRLRSAGRAASFSYKEAKLSKQLKQASDQNAQECIIIGDESKENKLTVKNMVTGEQKVIETDKFFAQLNRKSK